MTKLEMSQEEADELTNEDAAAIGSLVEGFMVKTGLKFGYTLLTFDRNGIKTMGNMPVDAQHELFTFLAGQMDTVGPDSMVKIQLDGERKH